MPKKSSFDFTIFDKYEWTGKGCAEIDLDKQIKTLNQNEIELQRQMDFPMYGLDVLNIYKLAWFRGDGGTYSVSVGYMMGLKWSKSVHEGTRFHQVLFYLLNNGYLRLQDKRREEKRSFVAPPREGSPSENISSSSSRITTAQKKHKGRKVNGAPDSERQDDGSNGKTDVQVIMDDYYKFGLQHYLKIDLGNVYADKKALGLVKKMLDQHGLEGTKKIIQGACFGYKSGALPFIVEAKLSIGAIYATRQDCLAYYEELENIKKYNRRVEVDKDGVHEGNVSATEAGA